MEGNKNKRRVISLGLKNEILAASGSQRDLSKQFDLPRSTIQKILSDKEAIQTAIADGHEAKRARLRCFQML
jgi:hypothetical protein